MDNSLHLYVHTHKWVGEVEKLDDNGKLMMMPIKNDIPYFNEIILFSQSHKIFVGNQ
jgi:hypothetical protein